MIAYTEGGVATEVRAACRRLDASRHPLLQQVSRDDIYDHGNWMAPGGLLLAERLAAALQLAPHSNVLDLGCGRGQSSVYLASRHRANVMSVDLWISAAERLRRAVGAGVGECITPLQGDIARGVPIEPGSLDAIFSLQAFHCFGASPWLLRYLVTLLKPGGRIGIAQGCFREEAEVLSPPFTTTDGWNAEYHKYHSPAWWGRHFAANDLLRVEHAEEVPDGDIMWEDHVLYHGDRAGWTPEYLAHSGWLIRQILAGQSASPTLTHCLVVATRCPEATGQIRSDIHHSSREHI